MLGRCVFDHDLSVCAPPAPAPLKGPGPRKKNKNICCPLAEALVNPVNNCCVTAVPATISARVLILARWWPDRTDDAGRVSDNA